MAKGRVSSPSHKLRTPFFFIYARHTVRRRGGGEGGILFFALLFVLFSGGGLFRARVNLLYNSREQFMVHLSNWRVGWCLAALRGYRFPGSKRIGRSRCRRVGLLAFGAFGSRLPRCLRRRSRLTPPPPQPLFSLWSSIIWMKRLSVVVFWLPAVPDRTACLNFLYPRSYKGMASTTVVWYLEGVFCGGLVRQKATAVSWIKGSTR